MSLNGSSQICLMQLVEVLNNMGYSLFQKTPTEWIVLEEPAFRIKVKSLSHETSDFVGRFIVVIEDKNKTKPPKTVSKYLTLSLWLSKLEDIAMTKIAFGRG